MTINRNLSILAGGVSSAGVLGVPNGGSGATTLTGYLIGNGTGAFTASATIPTSALSGTVSLTSQVSGILPIANGGTAQSSFTAGYVHYGSFSTSANLTFDGSNLLVGSNTAAYGTLNVARNTSAPYASFTITDQTTASNTVGIYLRQTAGSPAGISTAGAPIAFYVGGPGTTEVARIFGSGGVSIGNTTDPGATNLSVNGNLYVGTTAALGSSVCTFMNNSQYAGPQIVVRNNYNTAGKYWKIGQENNNSLAFYIYNASGVGQYMSDGGTSWLPNVSDERLKNKISDISNALEAVNKLKPLSFYYQNQEQSGIPNYGHFAQDVGNAIPDAMLVSPQKDKAFGDIYTYDPNIINVYLVKAVQELSAKFDAYVASHP